MDVFSCLNKKNGYLTVEATLIFPIVLSVIMFLLYVLFFSYNSCLMEQDINMVLIGAADSEDKVTETAQKVKKELEDIYVEKYYGFARGDIEFEIKHQKLRISQTGYLVFPVARQWEHTVCYEVKLTHPVETVRARRKLEKLKDNISKERTEYDKDGVY